jgi:putative tricarboxylic transport membrane protein
MPEKVRRVLPHTVMLAVSLVLYWMATRIDVDTGGRISPAFWPKVIVVFMGLLCAYEIVKRLVVGSSFEAQGVVSTAPVNQPEVGDAPPAPENPRMLAGGIALITAYVVAVPWLGFFVTTAIFLAVFPWIGGIRRPVRSAVIGLAGALVLVVMFMRIAYISLPLGEGPFRALSLALMRAIGVT